MNPNNLLEIISMGPQEVEVYLNTVDTNQFIFDIECLANTNNSTTIIEETIIVEENNNGGAFFAGAIVGGLLL